MKGITKFERTPSWGTTVIWGWLAFNLIDYITTVVGIECDLSEGNPLINTFADNALSLALFKIVTTGALLAITTTFMWWNVLKLATFFMFIICLWNAACLLTVMPKG